MNLKLTDLKLEFAKVAIVKPQRFWEGKIFYVGTQFKSNAWFLWISIQDMHYSFSQEPLWVVFSFMER